MRLGHIEDLFFRKLCEESAYMRKNKKDEDKPPMQNITINIPEIYEKNIQKLKEKGLVSSRSAAIRTALKEYLQKEYSLNLKLLNFFDKEK